MKLQIEYDAGGGAWTAETVRFANTAGTAVVAVTVPRCAAELLAGVYTLTLQDAGSGNVDVIVECADKANPYRTALRSVGAPGSTYQFTAAEGDGGDHASIPGLAIEWAAGCAAGDTATVTVGKAYGPVDVSGGGETTAGERVRVKNNESVNLTDCKARLLPSVRLLSRGNGGLAWMVFAYADPFAPADAHPGYWNETAAGFESGNKQSARIYPYRLTFANRSGLTVDMLVDGSTSFQVRDLTDDTLLPATTGLQIGKRYRLEDYPFTDDAGNGVGWEFELGFLAMDMSEVNLMIFPSEFVEIATDTAGVAGDYGTADVTLTEAGQSAGVITPGGVAYFWRRLQIPEAGNSESNPHPTDVAIEGTGALSADWWN